MRLLRIILNLLIAIGAGGTVYLLFVRLQTAREVFYAHPEYSASLSTHYIGALIPCLCIP